MKPIQLPGRILTVIIRDDSPFIHLGNSPVFRSVRVQLTEFQRHKLALRLTGTSGVDEQFESVSKCFIEPEPEPVPKLLEILPKLRRIRFTLEHDGSVGHEIARLDDVIADLERATPSPDRVTQAPSMETPAAPIVYFAVPGELPEPVKAFFLSLTAPIPVKNTPLEFHAVSHGDFFATNVKIERIGTPPWTKIEIAFVPKK